MDHSVVEEEDLAIEQKSWPRSYDDRKGSFRTYYDKILSTSQQKEWQIVSPMTQHVFPSEHCTNSPQRRISSSPTRIRKRRSRSFNDYIDSLESTTASSSCHDLNLPGLEGNSNTQQEGFVRSSTNLDGTHNNDDYNDAEQQNGYHMHMSIDEPSEIESEHDIYYNSYQKEVSNGPYGKDNRVVASDSEIGHDQSIQKEEQEERSNPLYVSILYGAINCTIVIPVVMSFGNIIYRDDAFLPYMPVLIKLTLVSGFIHQICFSALSTLKFSVGSVQDAGLIFLSSMAADTVSYCHKYGYNDETMLATVTVGLGLATALLGVGLVIIGKLGLAGYVQMLPTCVVAGYLAYIGWFVGYSGLGIMVGASSLTFKLLFDNIIYVLPGVAGGIFIYTSVQKFKHVAVLPICITLLLLTFYIGLAVTGSSVEEATENGWIRRTEKAPVWYHTWDYLQVDKVVWSALPHLWLTWSGMLFVVALSSSLDVAAIELEMKKPLNYNKELRMVGISNFVSGMTGGYTGSYIFSQSIFSLRIGIRSRMAGFTLAFFQLVIIVLPFPILSYVPNFFYGSLLSMICMDLIYEWLWEFRAKVTIAEYLIGLSTFAMIHFLGVEYGIIVGVVIYVICRQLNIDVGDVKKTRTQEDHALTEGIDDSEHHLKEKQHGHNGRVRRDVHFDDEVNQLIPNGRTNHSYKSLKYYNIE